MEFYYNIHSLRKHKVNRADVKEVLDLDNTTRRGFDMQLSRDENLRIMFVAYNLAGRLLEVGVEYIGEEKRYVFHTQSVSPYYRKLYEKSIQYD